MAVCNLCVLVVAVSHWFCTAQRVHFGFRDHACFSFLFSMFTVYGTRTLHPVGTAALLIMIFMIDKKIEPDQVMGLCLNGYRRRCLVYAVQPGVFYREALPRCTAGAWRQSIH